MKKEGKKKKRCRKKRGRKGLRIKRESRLHEYKKYERDFCYTIYNIHIIFRFIIVQIITVRKCNILLEIYLFTIRKPIDLTKLSSQFVITIGSFRRLLHVPVRKNSVRRSTSLIDPLILIDVLLISNAWSPILEIILSIKIIRKFISTEKFITIWRSIDYENLFHCWSVSNFIAQEHLPTKFMVDYSPSEIVNILFVFGECQINYYKASPDYRNRYPKREQHPNHSVIRHFEQRPRQGRSRRQKSTSWVYEDDICMFVILAIHFNLYLNLHTSSRIVTREISILRTANFEEN